MSSDKMMEAVLRAAGHKVASDALRDSLQPDRPISSGMPWWLPAEYMTASETIALGELDVGDPRACGWCDALGPTERAHIVRKGAGGKKLSGPTRRLCKKHHMYLDSANLGYHLAVRCSDRMVCLLQVEFTGLRSDPRRVHVRKEMGRIL
jgi:hypothetical protein